MKRYGFTLLETMLALTIIIMIVGTVYAFYSYSVGMVRDGREHLLESQLARVVLQHIAGEIRSVPGLGTQFGSALDGSEHEISVLTTVVPSRLVFLPHRIMDTPPPAEHDVRRVDYSIAVDDEEHPLGLKRQELRLMLAPVIEEKGDEELAETPSEPVESELSEGRAVRELPAIDEQILSDRIRYLEFEYYDGLTWQSQWHSMALPRAVRIIIGFEEIPEEELADLIDVPWSKRPWRDDQYALVVPLILSEELKARASSAETAEEGVVP